MPRFINGFFFQHAWQGVELELLDDDDHMEGFHGMIGTDCSDGRPCGIMLDRWGESRLSEIDLGGEHFSFLKIYTDGRTIRYNFRRQEDGVWVGEYSGPDSGKGVAFCVVTEVDERYMDPDRLARLVGREKPWNME